MHYFREPDRFQNYLKIVSVNNFFNAQILSKMTHNRSSQVVIFNYCCTYSSCLLKIKCGLQLQYFEKTFLKIKLSPRWIPKPKYLLANYECGSVEQALIKYFVWPQCHCLGLYCQIQSMEGRTKRPNTIYTAKPANKAKTLYNIKVAVFYFFLKSIYLKCHVESRKTIEYIKIFGTIFSDDTSLIKIRLIFAFSTVALQQIKNWKTSKFAIILFSSNSDWFKTNWNYYCWNKCQYEDFNDFSNAQKLEASNSWVLVF